MARRDEESARAAQEFQAALEGATDELAKLRQESGGASRQQSQAAGRGLSTINEITNAISSTSFVIGAFGDQLQKADGLLSVLGKSMSDAATGIQAVARTADIFGRAEGDVVGQLEGFALAGIDVPQAAIERAARISVQRQERAAQFRARAGRATAAALTELGFDAAGDIAAGLGF